MVFAMFATSLERLCWNDLQAHSVTFTPKYRNLNAKKPKKNLLETFFYKTPRKPAVFTQKSKFVNSKSF